jgi:hypothetical protein
MCRFCNTRVQITGEDKGWSNKPLFFPKYSSTVMASTRNAKKQRILSPTPIYSAHSPFPSPTSTYDTRSISSLSSFTSLTNNDEQHRYFNRPLTEWSLITFLKRTRPAHSRKNIDWQEEYNIYQQHINALFYIDKRNLFVMFEEGDFHEHIFHFSHIDTVSKKFACP